MPNVITMERDAVATDIPEIWKSIPGWEGVYDVSSIGRIRRSPSAPYRKSTWAGRILSGKPEKTGYIRVTLHAVGRMERMMVHRAVARAFLPPRPPGRCVNHVDGNKTNNVVSNLEWATPQENVGHAWRTGLCKPNAGMRHGASRLDDGDVYRIRRAYDANVALSAIAATFSVTEATVSGIGRRATWKHLKEQQLGVAS